MREVYLFVVLITAVTASCPRSDEIFPCRCFSISETLFQIECAGNAINNVALESVAPRMVSASGSFYELYIHDTKLADITANTFAGTVFNNIVIEDNEGLKTVDPFAFRKGNVNKLVIRRNKSLEDLRVYELARYLEPTDTVAFDGNALEEIVQNAFTPINPETNTLRTILINHNKVEKLHTNAFYGLPNIQLIGLDNNEIEEVHNLSLRFSEGNPRTITVKLNSNQNKEENVDVDSIVIPANVSLKLHVENNELSHLPQFEFKYLETVGNEIFLENNEIVCDCNLLWTLNEPQVNQIHNLKCKNLGFRDIKTVNVTEFCSV